MVVSSSINSRTGVTKPYRTVFGDMHRTLDDAIASAKAHANERKGPVVLHLRGQIFGVSAEETHDQLRRRCLAATGRS